MFLVEFLLNIIVLLFLLLFVLIYFITKYKKTIKEINMYEENFGVVYTKEVLEDMNMKVRKKDIVDIIMSRYNLIR